MIAILATIIILGICGLVAFPVAVVLGKAWEAIAWHFHLPLFDFWQMYFISLAFLILKPSSHTITNSNKTNNDTNVNNRIR